MRRVIVFGLLLACLWLGVSAPSEEAGERPKRFILPELEGVVLDEKEVPEWNLVNQNVFYWWKGERADGQVLSKLGVAQAFRDSQGRRVFVGYARFPDSSKARQAAEYYPKNVASVFRKGLWKGWEKRTIGDSCWVVVASTRATLMVQKGTLCLLIGCRIGHVEEAQRLAFSLAEKILAKEARREKKEKAPETPKGEQPKKFTLPELEGVVLDEKEAPGLKLAKQNAFRWWKAKSADGEFISEPGVGQEFRDSQARLTLVTYARFARSGDARQAADFYSKHMASVFRKGLWKGWEKKTIGESCWVVVASTRAGLLVQKGTLCLLISCHIVERDEAQRVAFALAEKILAKEARRKKGERTPQTPKGEQPKKFTLPELEDVVLDEKEAPGLRFVQQNASHWWKGETPEGEGLSQPSVIQEFRDSQARLTLVMYARFARSGDARQAADFYSKHMASVFRKGLWKGWEKKTIGDSSWVVVASTRAGSLVQKGTLCLLISCHIVERDEAQRVAFALAEKILAKEARRKKKDKPPQTQKDLDPRPKEGE